MARVSSTGLTLIATPGGDHSPAGGLATGKVARLKVGLSCNGSPVRLRKARPTDTSNPSTLYPYKCTTRSRPPDPDHNNFYIWRLRCAQT